MKATLENLAEKLDGNYWEKGNLKRVYLDKGNNTKKMSTKTFIWQDENGEFKVSCKIDCNSQPYEWINSQQEEIKNRVYEEIEKALATEYYFAKKKGTNLYFESGKLVEYKEVIDGELYPTKKSLLYEMDNCGDDPEQFDFIIISKKEIDNFNDKEKEKSIFDWSVEEIKKHQITNYTGGFKTDPNLAQNIYNICRNLEKQGKDDKYLRNLTNPLAISFIFHLNIESPITIVGTDTDFSFWQTEKRKTPVPLASTVNEMYWCYEIYEGTPINKEILDNDKINPQGRILHVYETGYFNSKN